MNSGPSNYSEYTISAKSDKLVYSSSIPIGVVSPYQRGWDFSAQNNIKNKFNTIKYSKFNFSTKSNKVEF